MQRSVEGGVFDSDPDVPGERLEQLRFAPALLSGNFEAALRQRVAQLAQFRHPCFARVRRIDRLESGTALAVVSDQPRGARLSHVLAVAERDGIGLDINAALCIVRQLVPAHTVRSRPTASSSPRTRGS